MMIEIAAGGGFGGIAAAGLHKTVDVSHAPEPLRHALSSAFGPETLARLASSPCRPCADRMTYRITVTGERGSRSFTLREDQIPPDMLDLMDRM